MPGIQITGKPSNSAAGGSSFRDGIINNSGTGGTAPPAGSGPAGNGKSSDLGAASSYATASIRSMGNAANMATAALTAFQRKLDGFRGGGGGGGGGGGRRGGGGKGDDDGIPYTRRDRETAGVLNSKADALYRYHQGVAEYENKQRDRQINQAAKNQDRAARDQQNFIRSQANHDNKRYDQSKANASRMERAQAEYENKQFDKKRDAAWDYEYSNAQYDNKKFDAAKRAKARQDGKPSMWGQGGTAMQGAQHMLGHIGGYGGVGAATSLLSFAMSNPKLLPVVAAGAIMAAPQIGAAAYGGFMSTTAPYRNFGMSAYGMARAGGFDGDSFISNLTDNGTNTSDSIRARLKKVGLGSSDAMAIMQQYGIGAKSSDDFVNSATGLGGMALNSNLGSMDQGQLIAAQRMLVGGGMGSIGSNTAAMSDFLANATSKGLDKSTMIQSMTSTLQTVAAAGGLGASLGSSIAMNSRMFSENNLAARSGASSADLAAGVASAGNDTYGNSMRGLMFNRAAAKIHSKGDLIKMIGARTYAVLSAPGNAAGQAQITGLLNPNTPLPMKSDLLNSVMSNDPTAYAAFAQSAAQSITSDPVAQAKLVSYMTNTGLGATYNNLYGTSSSGGGDALSKVPAAQLPALMAAAAKYGVDPSVLAAQYGIENGYGKNIGKNPKSSATGYFQFIDGTWKSYGKFNRKDFGQSVDAAAHYDSDLFAANGEAAGLDIYGGKGYANKIAGMGVNVDTSISGGYQNFLNDKAINSNMDLQGAKATFNELEGTVNNLAAAVTALQGAITNLSNGPNLPRGGRATPYKTPFTGGK